MKRFFTFIILLLPMALLSQSTITGTVKDEDGQPLPGANIYLDGTFEGTSSDVEGNFTLETTLEGEYILIVEYIGFEKSSIDLVLGFDNHSLTIELHERFNELKAATISAGAFEASDTKKAVVLRPLDIVTTAGASGDIAGALQTLPGTTTVGESGKLFVRGGESSETATFIDGLLVFRPFNSTAPNTQTRGRFNPFMFSGTVFSTGAYSAEYGQALSSVLVLNTNDLPTQSALNIGIMSVGGDVAGTQLWETGAVTANLSYTNLAPYLSFVPQNFEFTKPVEAVNGAVSIRQKTGSAGMLKLYANLSTTSFALTQPNSQYDNDLLNVELSNNNGFVNANYRTPLGEKWMLKVGASLTIDEDFVDLSGSDFTEEIVGGHVKMTTHWQPLERVKVRSGVEYYHEDYSQSFKSDDVDFFAGFVDERYTAFVEGDVHLSKKIVARIGLRGEESNLLNRRSLSPRISTAYKISDYSQISAAYGLFYQNPLDDFLIYDNNLDFERAEHYLLSAQYNKDDRILRAEVYLKEYSNLVKYDPGREFYFTEFDNTGTGFAHGFDVFWRDKKTIKNGDYWFSYSYLDSKRDYRDFPGSAVPTFVSKHNLSLVYKHWFNRLRSQVGMTYMYGSPRRYNDLNNEGFNEGRTKSFNSLNMNWSFLFRQNIIFFASASNILGFKNVFGYTFNQEPNDQGFYESQPIIPSADRFFFLGCFITLSKNKELNQLDKINDI